MLFVVYRDCTTSNTERALGRQSKVASVHCNLNDTGIGTELILQYDEFMDSDLIYHARLLYANTHGIARCSSMVRSDQGRSICKEGTLKAWRS